MNPIDLLNNLPVPAKYRKWIIYFLVPLAVLAYGVWQAVGGDWKAFWPALGAAVIGAIAHAFTTLGADTSDSVADYDSTDDEAPTSASPDPSPAVAATDMQDSAAQSNVTPPA